MRREAEVARAQDGVARHEKLYAAVEAGDTEGILEALGAHGARAYLK
jgi:DNA-binding GntR family transcriptional regulator